MCVCVAVKWQSLFYDENKTDRGALVSVFSSANIIIAVVIISMVSLSYSTVNR